MNLDKPSLDKTAELPKEKLKLLFSDVLRGFCMSDYNNQPVKIRHLTHFDVADFDIKYNEYFEEARKQGAPNIEEREKFLIEEGSWSEQKNKGVRDQKFFIAGMRETKTKLFRQAEIEQLNKTIKEAEDKIRVLEEERIQLLQCTAESFATKKITEYQIFKSFFAGDNLFFNEDRFEDLNDVELSDIANLYNEKFRFFNERNFKRVALSNFFLNSFYLCKDNPFTFYGKPVVQLTFFQVEIFAHAVFFKHILSNSPNKPPAHILEDPDFLIDWYNSTKSVKEVLDKGKKPEDIVGLSNKDKELLGMQQSNPHQKMIDAAKRKGGPLSASEIMKIQGVL